MKTASRRQMEERTPEAQARVLRRLFGDKAATAARSFADAAIEPTLADFWRRTAALLED